MVPVPCLHGNRSKKAWVANSWKGLNGCHNPLKILNGEQGNQCLWLFPEIGFVYKRNSFDGSCKRKQASMVGDNQAPVPNTGWCHCNQKRRQRQNLSWSEELTQASAFCHCLSVGMISILVKESKTHNARVEKRRKRSCLSLFSTSRNGFTLFYTRPTSPEAMRRFRLDSKCFYSPPVQKKKKEWNRVE